jgi:hypothetical protein
VHRRVEPSAGIAYEGADAHTPDPLIVEAGPEQRLGSSAGPESGFRYTPTTTFETFPFPRPSNEQRDAIAAATKRLDELRTGWLDPPGATDAELKVRTLTNLYNERPAWLRDIHARLDSAVLAAYGWPSDIADDDILARLLALNLERSLGHDDSA